MFIPYLSLPRNTSDIIQVLYVYLTRLNMNRVLLREANLEHLNMDRIRPPGLKTNVWKNFASSATYLGKSES